MIKNYVRFLSLTYILVSVLLAIFLISARSGVYYNQLFFWAFIFYLLLVNLFFIYLSDSNSIIRSIIFIQMVIFLIIIRIPYRTTFGLYGVDSPTEYYVTMHILNNGWKVTDSLLSSSYYNQLNYPFLYLINIIFSEISGKSILMVENWFPVVLTLITPFFVYLSSYELFNSKKSALFTFFGFSTLYGYMIFHSLTLRESIGFVFLSQIIYMVLKLDKNSTSIRFKYTMLILLLVFSLILSHHLTSFMLLLFLGVSIGVSSLLKLTNKRLPKSNFSNVYLTKTNFSLLVFIIYIAYWIYAYNTVPSRSPLTMLVNSFLQIIELEASGHSVDIVSSFPGTIRYQILLDGAIIFGLIFAFLSSLTVLYRWNKLSIYEISFIITASIPGIFGALSATKIFGLPINAERFMVFTYFYLFVLSGYSASKLLSHKLLKCTIFLVFLFFSLFNVYTIHPYLYTANEPDYTHGEIRSYIYYTEYLPFNWINLHSSNEIYAHKETSRLLTPFIQNLKIKVIVGSLGSLVEKNKNVSYITIPKKSIPYLTVNDSTFIFGQASEIYNNSDSKIILFQK